MVIEHSLDIPQNLNGIHIFLPLHTILICGVISILLWCGSDVVWCHRSRSECHPNKLLCIHQRGRRKHCSWSVERQLEYWLVRMALLTIQRLHSEFRRQFSICPLWQCGPNGMYVRGQSWCKYKPFGGNLRGWRWGEVDISLFSWFC